jgi:hypothetical protein
MKSAAIPILALMALPSLHAHPEAELSPLVVTGKADDLLGEAASASEGTASAADLLAQPYLRRSEIIEATATITGGSASKAFIHLRVE